MPTSSWICARWRVDWTLLRLRRSLAAGAQSPRLLHGLALAANSFPTPLHAFGRLPKGTIDLKKTGLAPIVLLARLYGLRARSTSVGTDQRLADAAARRRAQ